MEKSGKVTSYNMEGWLNCRERGWKKQTDRGKPKQVVEYAAVK